MNRIQELYSKSDSSKEFISGYLDYLTETFKKVNVEELDKFIKLLLDTRETGNTVYFIGNGGSAAAASHFANDLAIGTRSPNNPFRAFSLTDNNTIATAISNDFGYEYLFVKQLETCLNKNDVLVSISASGNSPNIIKATEYANTKGARTVGITGFDGGELKKISELSVHVPSGKGEFGPVEDLHMIFNHIIGSYLSMKVKDES
jgi:D-sedoheptulose 7-phosphate isomerase